MATIKKTKKTATKKTAAKAGAQPVGSATKASIAAEKAEEAKKAARAAKNAQQRFPIFSPDAAAWVYGQSIPGSLAPIFFLGEKNMRTLADKQGFSVTLEQVKSFVKPDGPVVKCAYILDLKKRDDTCKKDPAFQPVAYAIFPENFAERLETTKVEDMKLRMGGAYYLTERNELMAVSGSVYFYDPNRRCYKWNGEGGLVTVATARREITGVMEWGKPLEVVREAQLKKLGAEKHRKEVRNFASQFVSLGGPRRPQRGNDRDRRNKRPQGAFGNQLDTAFQEPRPLKKRRQ